MAYNDPKNDGKKELVEIDFNLLERQFYNHGEFGCISVDKALEILKSNVKKDSDDSKKQRRRLCQKKS